MNLTTSSVKHANKKSNPWSWVPSLYFAEGLPYVIIITISVIMYKRLGISNTDIALYTSWLYLPWVIKPLWSPIVDVFKTKRFWILSMQFIIGAGMACIGLTLPLPEFFQFTLIIFWLLAFLSATHNTAIDGFYMLGLSESQQSAFVGIRSTFYRVAIIVGQGLLVVLAGQFESAMSVNPTQIQVAANPNKFFEETIKVDSIRPKELPGSLRLIANPSYVEISTHPKTREQLNFYLNFAKSFNIMNGFQQGILAPPDTAGLQDLVGNIGIVKLHLSKAIDEGDEYNIDLDFLEGNDKVKVVEGKSLHFTSKNWDKPAFAIIQLDSTIAQKTSAVFKAQTQKIPLAWSFTFGIITVLFIFFFIYHRIILPQPPTDVPVGRNRSTSAGTEFFRSFARFFEKKKIIVIILFLLLYHFGQAQLVKLASPFMLDTKETGGLGLSTSQVGTIYGISGMIALMIGGILGGFAVARKGLKYWLWPMLIAINVPDLVYVYLSFIQPAQLWIIYICVAIESFGYGFGFTFFIMYMIYISEGEYKTSHFAIAAGFMALGMMIPGMFSGMIQEAIGYKYFFIWVIIATIPGFFVAKFIPLEYGFGKKKLSNE
jgi:MFS transporter, PAT family, beta-lactamase induction signal transducer AmpG